MSFYLFWKDDWVGHRIRGVVHAYKEKPYSEELEISLCGKLDANKPHVQKYGIDSALETVEENGGYIDCKLCQTIYNKIMENKKQLPVKPGALLELVKKLPDSKNHIHIDPFDGKPNITNEWFADAFAGRSFDGDTFEDAAEKLIEYIEEHSNNHPSVIGCIVKDMGWPDLEKVYEYCTKKSEI